MGNVFRTCGFGAPQIHTARWELLDKDRGQGLGLTVNGFALCPWVGLGLRFLLRKMGGKESLQDPRSRIARGAFQACRAQAHPQERL